jgi:phage FluMu protein Com
MPQYDASRGTVRELRCWRCNRKLAEMVSSPWLIKCPRCKAANQQALPVEVPASAPAGPRHMTGH